MTIPSEVLKKCGNCGTEKPLAEFYIRSNGKPHSACKPCYREAVTARRHGPEKASILLKNRISSRKHRKKVRDQVFKGYGGYKCVCCGETEPMFLTLDHINNDGAEFRTKHFGNRTSAGYHTYKWLIKNNFPDDVQVMCMNCQHGKLMNNGICPHQKTCNDYPVTE